MIHRNSGLALRIMILALFLSAIVTSTAIATQPLSPPTQGDGGVGLTIDDMIYSGDGRQVDIPLTVTNFSVAEGVAGGRYYPERTADGQHVKWVTLFRSAEGPIPHPIRDDAPVWEFVVTLDDGTQFTAFAGCLYRSTVVGSGYEFDWYWEVTLKGSWFDCGNAYQVKPEDIPAGASGSSVLTVYLYHPNTPKTELLPRRRVAHLDFYAYTPAGTALGLVASVDFDAAGNPIPGSAPAAAPAPATTEVEPIEEDSAPTTNSTNLTGLVGLKLDDVIYSGDGGQVDIPMTVTNFAVPEGVAGGRYYPERTADGKHIKWVTLFQAAEAAIPRPIRDDAPVWEFIVTLDDGTQFPAFAGCIYRSKVIASGYEFEWYWEIELEGSWFDCGNAYQVKPEDIFVGASGSSVLTVYLYHPNTPKVELLPRRRVVHLDFYAYTPSGTPLGLLASVNVP